MEHSQGLLEVLSALGGSTASPAAATDLGSMAPAALPQNEWKEQGKLVQQLVLVLLQILTMHPEVGAGFASVWRTLAVCAICETQVQLGKTIFKDSIVILCVIEMKPSVSLRRISGL